MASKKGIPKNLRPLAEAGERVRFNGFWLNASDQDRAIAKWIDDTPAAATIIKHVLYQYISGAGVSIPVGQHVDDFEIDEDDDMINALLDFDD